MAATALRRSGTLAKWDDERGFGFISPVDGAPDLFVHISGFLNQTLRPTVGEPLSFEVGHSSDGRERAVGVTRESSSHRPPRVIAQSRPVRFREKELVRPHSPILGFLALAVVAGAFAAAQYFWKLPTWIDIYLLAINLLTFGVYAADKRAASRGAWRTSEGLLLFLGFLGGWPAAVLAQEVLRHKTRKASFLRAFGGTVIANVVLTGILGLFAFGGVQLSLPNTAEEPIGGGASQTSSVTIGGWSSAATLRDHYARHGAAFGATSPRNYDRKATNFLRSAVTRHYAIKVTDDGTVRVYDKHTNSFGVYASDGRIKTFFKPDDGAAYWNRQPGRSP